MDGGGRALPRPGMSKQDVCEWRANPRGGGNHINAESGHQNKGGRTAYGGPLTVCPFFHGRLSLPPQAGALRLAEQAATGLCNVQTALLILFAPEGRNRSRIKRERVREAGTHPMCSFAYSIGPCGLLCKPQRARQRRADRIAVR